MAPGFISIAAFIIGFGFGGAVIWFVRQRELDAVAASQTSLKTEFDAISRAALAENSEEFLKLAKTRFETLVNESEQKLAGKKDLIDASVQRVNAEVKGLTTATTSLKGQLQESSQTIGRLGAATGQIEKLLSSSQKRGQWGEKMVEDILGLMGLREGINYVSQDGTRVDGRPDFTFNLPHGQSVNLDVKFPLSHYEGYLAADDDTQKEIEKKAFLKDVRAHVKTLAGREYIDPSAGTVNYVLMFIPNEGIYSFMNEEDHELIDYSLRQKVVLCSPITLYAVLSLVRQAVENFSLEKRAAEIQDQVGKFQEQWVKFKVKLAKLGNTLGTLNDHYEQVERTRSNQLEKPMEKIVDLQLGDDGDDQPQIEPPSD